MCLPYYLPPDKSLDKSINCHTPSPWKKISTKGELFNFLLLGLAFRDEC